MAFVQSVAELLVWLFDNGFEDCEKVTFEGFSFILRSLYRPIRFIYSEGVFCGGASFIQHVICNSPQPMNCNDSVK